MLQLRLGLLDLGFLVNLLDPYHQLNLVNRLLPWLRLDLEFLAGLEFLVALLLRLLRSLP